MRHILGWFGYAKIPIEAVQLAFELRVYLEEGDETA